MEIIRCIYNVSFSLYMFSFGLFIIDMWKSFIFISLTRVTYCLLRACNNKWFVYNFPLFSTYSILIYLYLKAYCIFFSLKLKRYLDSYAIDNWSKWNQTIRHKVNGIHRLVQKWIRYTESVVVYINRMNTRRKPNWKFYQCSILNRYVYSVAEFTVNDKHRFIEVVYRFC